VREHFTNPLKNLFQNISILRLQNVHITCASASDYTCSTVDRIDASGCTGSNRFVFVSKPKRTNDSILFGLTEAAMVLLSFFFLYLLIHMK
jgi:hypothetical protein